MNTEQMREALQCCIAALERVHHATEADRLAAADKARAALATPPASQEQAQQPSTGNILMDAFNEVQASKAKAQHPKNNRAAVLADRGFDVHDDEEGRTWLTIRNPDDDVARMGVPTVWPLNGKQTIGAVVLHQFSAALIAALAAAQAHRMGRGRNANTRRKSHCTCRSLREIVWRHRKAMHRRRAGVLNAMKELGAAHQPKEPK